MKCTNQNKLLPQSKFCKGNPDSYVNKVKIENFELYRKNGKIYKNSNFKVVLESNKMTHIKTSLQENEVFEKNGFMNFEQKSYLYYTGQDIEKN